MPCFPTLARNSFIATITIFIIMFIIADYCYSTTAAIQPLSSPLLGNRGKYATFDMQKRHLLRR